MEALTLPDDNPSPGGVLLIMRGYGIESRRLKRLGITREEEKRRTRALIEREMKIYNQEPTQNPEHRAMLEWLDGVVSWIENHNRAAQSQNEVHHVIR